MACQKKSAPPPHSAELPEKVQLVRLAWRFGSIQHGRSFCRTFFAWYNHDHYHTGIGLLTPAMVHSGQAAAVLRKRHEVLEDAYAKHPERFVRHPPRPQALPPEVWINNPVAAIELEEAVH